VSDDGDKLEPLEPLDAALVAAAVLIGRKRGVKTALVSADDALDIEHVSQVIADRGSPPLRYSVARDLAAAGFTVRELRPLLTATIPDGADVTDLGLTEQLATLKKLGPTVDWQSFSDTPGDPS